ncbi:MAG: hypothetical protein GY781_18915 [Gammaproteobacteria bacterium]|nr:hypothetical protein [Gammaproteobacteria bacterium]
MCGYFDNFDDDYDESMDDDSFEDSLEGEMDEPFADEPGHEDEPDEAESQDDDFTAKDAFFSGWRDGFCLLRRTQRRKKEKAKKIQR